MNCPECSIRLRPNATSCSCGWSSLGDTTLKLVKRATCYGCQKDLPWPSHKQIKADHRIIGRTFRNEPICNLCYSKSPEWDWRSEAARDFAERHKDDNWGVLYQMSHALKGASKEDCSEFMGYLKDEARKAGGLAKKLPYDPSKRERA